jgi:hypothetical protein
MSWAAFMKNNGSRIGGIIYALICSGLFAFPLLTAIYYHGDFTYLTNESVAYRYFLSERLVEGDNTAWIWNGQLTTAIQNVIFFLINRYLEPTDLQGRLQLFSFLTLGCYAVLMAGLFFVAGQNQKIKWIDRLLLAIVGLAPLYATKSQGFYYFLLPDYITLDVILAAGAVFLFQRECRLQPPDGSLSKVALLSGYGGLIAANKLFMAVPAVFLVGPSLLAHPHKISDTALRLIVAVASGLFVFLGVLLFFFLFDISGLQHMLPAWIRALRFPNGETNFWTEQWAGIMDAYWFIAALWIGATAVAIIHLIKDGTWRDGIVMICNIFGAMAALYILLKRPATTTAFEVSVLLVTFTAILLSSISQTKFYTGISLAAIAGLILYAGITFPIAAHRDWVAPSSDRARVRWQLHDEVIRMATGRKIITVIPGNEYHYDGVQELLLKGAADFGTWNISSSGQKIIDRYAPGMTFRNETMGGESPNKSYPDNILVLWWDDPNKQPLVEKYAALLEAINRKHVSCRRWDIPDNHFVVSACLLP